MNLKNYVNKEWEKLFFEEAERWNDLPYGHKCMEEYIDLGNFQEPQNRSALLDEYKKNFDEMEEFYCYPIYSTDSIVRIYHKKIEDKNPIQYAKSLLISLHLECLSSSKPEDNLKEKLLEYIQEGLLGKIEVIDIHTMKEDCNMYYNRSYDSFINYKKRINDLYEYDPEGEKVMNDLKERLLRLNNLPEHMKVIRSNLLYGHLSQVYDLEYNTNSRKVINKEMYQEDSRYIMVIDGEIYVVTISDFC